MIFDLTEQSWKPKAEQRLEDWNRSALQSGDPLNDLKAVHWGAMQGYAAAIVDFCGEDEAEKLLSKVRGRGDHLAFCD